jgi:parvulin-like peptidyl-prolyl isomerase
MIRYSSRRALIPAVLLVCLVPLAGCGPKSTGSSSAAATSAEAGAPSAPPSGEVILRVGETPYTGADFERYVHDQTGQAPAQFEAATLSRLFDRFVEERLLLKAARDENVSLTPEEQKASLARLIADRDYVPDRAGAADETQAFLDRALIEKYTALLMKDVQVGDQEIAQYYAAHKREFLEPARVRVSQILLPSEEKAVALLSRLKTAGEAEFRTAARQESVGLEAPRGGEMGLFRPGQLPYEMEKVVFALAEGEVSRVVESSYGFHIFRVDKRFEPELVPVERAAPAIRARILADKGRFALDSRLDALRARSDWQAFPENLSFPYQRNNQ